MYISQDVLILQDKIYLHDSNKALTYLFYRYIFNSLTTYRLSNVHGEFISFPKRYQN